MLNYLPAKVAQWEVKAWQAHHSGNKYRLGYFLMRQHMELFGIHSWQALTAMRLLIPAIRAHNFTKKEEAEKHLVAYYTQIKDYTSYTYDVAIIAHKEAAWWWIHDELEHETNKQQLIQAFAELYASILCVPVSATLKTGELRTQATIYHDLAEDKNSSSDQTASYWKKTEQLLKDFYTELLRVDHSANLTNPK